MIELRTGLPGNGKTLSVIQELAAMLKKWDKPSEVSEARPIFVHNVKDLILPHTPFPFTEEVNQRTGAVRKIPDWSQIPDGSFCIIDECQDFFPPRSSQSEAPPHIAWLNTHRHHGVDLVLITQHPKLIDGSVRALVGKHKHYRRVFGMNRSIVYEWDACSDSLSGLKTAVTSYWSFPKDAYQWYKSAEVHTKQKFRLPLWLGIPLIGLALGLFFVPKAYSTLTKGVKGESLQTKEVAPVHSISPAQPQSQSSPGTIAPTTPAVVQAGSPSPEKTAAPVFVGCISSAKKCSCITDKGQVVDNPPRCRESSQRFGSLINPTLRNDQTSLDRVKLPNNQQEQKPAVESGGKA